MTENEALEYLNYMLQMMADEPPENMKNERDIQEWEDEHKKIRETLEMVIQALEEIQQYRAIGTVEECRTAVERMKPRKVVNKKGFIIAKDKGGNEFYEANPYCPSCNTPIDNGGTAKGVYCKWCGQRFDWSE